jgi:hypothetical protein
MENIVHTTPVNECERIVAEAFHKFQRLDAKRQKTILEKMNADIESITDADIKDILIKLKMAFRRRHNEN